MSQRYRETEYVVDPKLNIYSETDTKGMITSVNEGFIEISGFSESELLGKPHSIVRHPDMPKLVFKLLWDTINKQKKMSAIVKNLRKDGQYYWVYSEYEPIVQGGELTGFRSFRRPIPRTTINAIEVLYNKLQAEEKQSDVKHAELMLDIFLLQANASTYQGYVDRLYEKELKGLFGGFFKKLFGRK